MRRALRGITTIAGFASLVLAFGSLPAQASPAADALQPHIAHSCNEHVQRGQATCFALKRTDILHPALAPNTTPSGLGPADIQSAYNLGSGGSGQTVAIVDANDDPNAESDLATYRSQYGLPECSTANGCFSKVNENGQASPLPAGDTGWAGEISLDVDMVSATCPSCNILLVEANTASIADLGQSVNTAVSLGAKYVSNSYGGSEDGSETSSDSQYYSHPGVAITASTGDSGYGASYPATGAGVTAVGGTSLSADGSSRGWSETAWSGGGSGCSTDVPAPSFQSGIDTGCSNRAEADVSAVADPNTGVAVYQTYGGSGWAVYGGTSASSPIIASVYALAGAPGSSDSPNSYPYAHPGSLFDVTSGSNGSCSASVQCNAGTGWDGPTGLGTPNGTAAFRP
jgi:subtilase family serine protease